ncbi:MAG: HD family hydrolase [Anaerolineae bacterium]|nr:HD family hydrolase [Anaerolineae bacterium]
MDTDTPLAFLQRALTLKNLPRTGWAMRGLNDVESVAEHTLGTTLVALTLMEYTDAPLDREKVLTIALLHDLPECILSDIPTPATRYFPPQTKQQAEDAIMAHVLSGLPNAAQFHAGWSEFEHRTSPEGRLVCDADRLDMLIQATAYEETRGCRLDEFWEHQAEQPFFFPAAQALYEALARSRNARLRPTLSED